MYSGNVSDSRKIVYFKNRGMHFTSSIHMYCPTNSSRAFFILRFDVLVLNQCDRWMNAILSNVVHNFLNIPCENSSSMINVYRWLNDQQQIHREYKNEKRKNLLSIPHFFPQISEIHLPSDQIPSTSPSKVLITRDTVATDPCISMRDR